MQRKIRLKLGSRHEEEGIPHPRKENYIIYRHKRNVVQLIDKFIYPHI